MRVPIEYRTDAFNIMVYSHCPAPRPVQNPIKRVLWSNGARVKVFSDIYVIIKLALLYLPCEHGVEYLVILPFTSEKIA